MRLQAEDKAVQDQELTVQLSERELQVLEMVATGASNQQIARQLVISVNTVKVHLRNIFEKLEVQSRTEATMRAIQEGWIVLPDEASRAAEAAPAPARSYLLAPALPASLAPWQQLYLLLATLLALAVVIIPLLPRETLYLPVITPYDKQQPTPTAAAPANPASNRWVSHATMPTGRAGLALAPLEGRIFAIGGRRDIGTTGLLEIYDSSGDRWTEGPAKPTAVTDMAAAVLGGKIYVPGGCAERRQPVKKLEIYDPETEQWDQGPNLPAARCGYGLATWQDQLYLFGGWDGESYETTIFVFSPQKNKWQTLPFKMPQAKGYFGAATLGDKIYIAGGYDGSTEFSETHVFSPTTGIWQEKAPLHEKRGGLGLVTAANNLYAIGGGWERPLPSSEKYNPKTDEWTMFEAPFTEQWSNLALTAIDTKIYAVGGWNGGEGKYRDNLVSYQFLFQIFVPVQ